VAGGQVFGHPAAGMLVRAPSHGRGSRLARHVVVLPVGGRWTSRTMNGDRQSTIAPSVRGRWPNSTGAHSSRRTRTSRRPDWSWRRMRPSAGRRSVGRASERPESVPVAGALEAVRRADHRCAAVSPHRRPALPDGLSEWMCGAARLTRSGGGTRRAVAGLHPVSGVGATSGGRLNGMSTWIAEGRAGPSSGSALWARMMARQAWRSPGAGRGEALRRSGARTLRAAHTADARSLGRWGCGWSPRAVGRGRELRTCRCWTRRRRPGRSARPAHRRRCGFRRSPRATARTSARSCPPKGECRRPAGRSPCRALVGTPA
jgi:hypothetical protein